MKPEFSEKLRHVQSTLSGLKADEAFFSIDEFGPFAINRVEHSLVQIRKGSYRSGSDRRAI
jgi:hypothetical protein